MDTAKPSRRKTPAKKLEPIDWHEFANDAVLQGNMSTLYRRPAAEDPTAYASAEALAEISKRLTPVPTVGIESTVGPEQPVGNDPTVGIQPTAKTISEVAPAASPLAGPTVGTAPTGPDKPTVGSSYTEGAVPTVGTAPSVGRPNKQKVKAIRNVHDALTLAGQVLYKAMYGAPDGSAVKSCTKGYRQLAAETHLDKDTVRDLITEFKEKGIAVETGTYDPDTRSSKTYEIRSSQRILEIWHEAGVQFVTAGRQRPTFCTASGEPAIFKPTVGPRPRVSRPLA